MANTSQYKRKRCLGSHKDMSVNTSCIRVFLLAEVQFGMSIYGPLSKWSRFGSFVRCIIRIKTGGKPPIDQWAFCSSSYCGFRRSVIFITSRFFHLFVYYPDPIAAERERESNRFPPILTYSLLTLQLRLQHLGE